MGIRIIGEAGIRLRADGRGLGVEIRGFVAKALTAAQASQRDDAGSLSPTGRMRDQAEKDSNSIRQTLGKILGAARGVAGGIASTIATGMKLALIGTAAVTALAGVTQLGLGVGALIGAVLQASGVVGLLPAALAGVVVVSTAVKLATTGMGDAFKAIASGDAAAFEESLKKLSPAAQDFARDVRAIKPAFDDMRLRVQNDLFEELAGVVQPLSSTYLPVFESAFRGVSRQLGIAGKQTAEFLLQSAQVQRVGVFTANLQSAWGNLTKAIQPAVSAILDVVSTGSTFLPQMTAGVTAWATNFAAKIRAMSENGELQAFFQRSIQALRTLGQIGSNVFGALRNIMSAARDTGAGLLVSLDAMTKKFEQWTGSMTGQSALTGFFESMRSVMDAMAPVILDLLTIVGRDLLPIFADLAQIIGPVLSPLLQVFGRLLQAARPLISAIADALGQVLAAFGPVIDAFATAVDDAMPTLGPMISEIGEAFANLVKSLAPLAPVFVQLLMAVLPILPPFIQMIADLMPRFIEIAKAMIPLITAYGQAFATTMPIMTAIVGFLLDIFIPVFQLVILIFSTLINVVTATVGGIWSVITTVFSAIGSFIADIWNGISSFFSQIWATIAGVFSGGLLGIAQRLGEWARQARDWGIQAMNNLGRAVAEGVQNVVQFFIDLPGKIANAIIGIGRWLYQAGVDLLRGLVEGIMSAVQGVIDSVIGVVEDAINAAKDLLGIFSPSKVFRRIGEQTGEGLALGIASMGSTVALAAEGLAQAAVAGAGDIALDGVTVGPGSGAGGLSAPGGTIVQQTNVMRPGTDINQFARQVLQRGYGDFLTGGSTLGVARNGVQAGINDQWVTA